MYRALAPVAALFVVATAGACGFLIDVTAHCPDLKEACPDLQCPNDRFKQGNDGCSQCECADAGNTTATVCWDDGDCASGQRCDTVNFCDPPPGCSGGAPCPDACYGECVATSATCLSDTDCPQGQVCAAINNGGTANDRPSDPSSGGGGSGVAPVPAPSGVCVDATCSGKTTDGSVSLPECPPGTEPGIDPAIDPCTPTCIAVDVCRSLPVDVCPQTQGCTVVPGTDLCVATDDCGSLDAATCEANPNCVLKPIGNTSSGGSGPGNVPCDPTNNPNCGAPPPPCDPNDPSCAPPPCDSATDPSCKPPPPSLVCVPRSSDGTCLSDADCLAGDACQLTTLCGTGCFADGSCLSTCWTDAGVCVPGTNACASVPADQCNADVGCALSGTACVPVSTSCGSDADCASSQHCAQATTCPPCNPQNGGDLNCAAPCFVEGTCIDGAAPPQPCNADADCTGAPSTCMLLTVCETCPKAPGGSGSDQNVPAPPCDPACTTEAACVPLPFDPGGPGGGVPCTSDGDCAQGQRCALELNSPVCVDNGSSSLCLSDSDCTAPDGSAETCRFDADVCLQDPSATSQNVCEGWCVGVCGNVVTTAQDPSTGQCKTFNDTCIPPGWQTVQSCPTPPPQP